MKHFLNMAAVALLLQGGQSFAASPRETYPDPEKIPKVFLKNLSYGEVYQESYISGFLDTLRGANGDRQFLSQADVDDLAKQIDFRKRQERYLSLVGYDRNFDGSVNQIEVSDAMKEDRRRQKQSEEGCADEAGKFVARFDADKDGLISLKEMSTPPSIGKGYRDISVRRLSALLALDPDKDGRLTPAELEALARKAFATLDTDGDNTLSAEETSTARDLSEEF